MAAPRAKSRPLAACIVPAGAFIVAFWVFAVQDYLCSLFGGEFCKAALLREFGVAGFGLAGASTFAFGSMFLMLFALRGGKVRQAAYVVLFVSLLQVVLFEGGIALTDGWEWDSHVLMMQTVPSLAWAGFFTNAFLFWSSFLGLVLLGAIELWARLKNRLSELVDVVLSGP